MSMNTKLHDYMQKHGLTQQQVANQIGKSVTTISQYLNGKYAGNVADIDAAIERMMGRAKDQLIEKQFNSGFVRTHLAAMCLDVINFAHSEGDINVITGAAGLGKTVALKHYVANNPEVIFIEVDPSYSPKVLLRHICHQIGVIDTGLNHELFARIISKLSLGRLIIVDEAELLSTKSLEYIRRIHDLTGCGVVLVGMPRLLVNLKGQFGELAQLYSRAGFHCDLGNALSEEDIFMLAEKGLGTDHFNPILFKASRGNARRLNKLMRGVVRSSQMNQRPIDEKMINSFANMLIH